MNPFQSGDVKAVWVVHAARLVERAAYIKAYLARFQIPFQFIEPFDVEALDQATQNHYFAPDAGLSLGKMSCALKHIEALRRIAAANHRLALVFEDDVVLHERFNEELAAIIEEARAFNHPYVIYLGCANNMYVPGRSVKPGKRLYEATRSRANDSYLLGAAAARLRLEWLGRNKIDRSADHLWNIVDREQGIKIYWSEPTIVEQGSMNGTFVSSLEKSTMSKPRWYVAAQFWWQRLRKKHIYRLFQ